MKPKVFRIKVYDKDKPIAIMDMEFTGSTEDLHKVLDELVNIVREAM